MCQTRDRVGTGAPRVRGERDGEGGQLGCCQMSMVVSWSVEPWR